MITQVILAVVASSFAIAEDVDILILGAGYSGIGAAMHFEKNNVKNYLVLEANDYIGGRVKNVKVGNSSLPLGAGWVHYINTNHMWYQIAKKNGLKMRRDQYKYSDIIYRNGQTGVKYPTSETVARTNFLINRTEIMDALLEKRLAEGKNDIDLKTGLRWSGWHVNNVLDQAVEYFMFDFENGIEPDALSATSYGYTGSGDDNVVNDPRGYIYPILEEIKPFRNKFLLNKWVMQVEKLTNGSYMIHVKDGSKYTAKHVLVTFSSGVLSDDMVNFNPPLPAWKKEALSMVPMCHYCKLFLNFETKFWDKSPYFIIATKFRGQYMHWQNLDHIFNTTNWVLATITGDICRDSFLYTDVEIKQQIFDMLTKVYPNASRPTALIRNTWSKDDRFRGAYSYQVAGISVDDYIALEHPVDGRLWFTGEYTGRYEFGYAHGALKLGTTTAKNMEKCFVNMECPSKEPEKTLKPKACVNNSASFHPSFLFIFSLLLLIKLFI